MVEAELLFKLAALGFEPVYATDQYNELEYSLELIKGLFKILLSLIKDKKAIIYVQLTKPENATESIQELDQLLSS